MGNHRSPAIHPRNLVRTSHCWLGLFFGFGAAVSIQAYCELNAGRSLQFQLRVTDVIEFDQPTHEGIEVREHATLGEFLRELQPPRGE